LLRLIIADLRGKVHMNLGMNTGGTAGLSYILDRKKGVFAVEILNPIGEA